MTEFSFWGRFFGLWMLNILVGIDQLAAALCGLDPDETLSSWFGKQDKAGVRWVRPIVIFLDWIDERHCAKSIELDEGSHSVWVFLRKERPKIVDQRRRIRELEAELATLRSTLADQRP